MVSELPADLWVGPKWQKTVTLPCGLIMQNLLLEWPCGGQKIFCKSLELQS